MSSYPSKGESVWRSSAAMVRYPTLDSDLHIDVAIIGGGIAGLTTAYLLKKRGRKVAVFEKDTIGSRVSGYTTSKVTSQHSLTYDQLVNKFDKATAKIYAESNQAAIEQIEEIIKTEQIDCDWRREDNYVFTDKDGEVEKLRQEAKVARELGLPASFVIETPLPFDVKGAVRFENQATFNIMKYLQGLAAAIDGDDSYVFEYTKASHFKDAQLCHFETPTHSVLANHVIHATNAPSSIKDHAAYAAFEYPTRSYIVAGPVDKSLPGMYINTGSPTRSILHTEFDGQPWALIGGEGHFTGMSGPAKSRYKTLVEYGQRYFGMQETKYKWSTWDFVAYDQLPLIGKLYPWSKKSYVITGLRKWGMTNATVGAMILTDQITEVDNTWAYIYRPDRLSAVLSLPQGLFKGLGFHK